MSKRAKNCHTKTEQLLLRFIVSAALAFTIVENKYFKKFIESLNSSFKIPSRYILSKQLLSNEYEKLKLSIKQELWQAKALSITLDTWTSIQNYSYLGVTCHFFSDNTNLISRTLDIVHLPGSHTSENLSNAIFSILQEWKITDKLVAFVTDNANNMTCIKRYLVESIRNVQQKNVELHHLGCLAHLINLIVKKLTKFTKQSGENYVSDDQIENENNKVHYVRLPLSNRAIVK